MQGAYLDLDFFLKECYGIVYGNEMKLMLDYKGKIKTVKRFSISPLRDVYAKIVREGDILDFSIKDGQQSVDFRPIVFNDNPIVGAFAVAYFEDGSMQCEVMSKAEVDHIRDKFSKQAKGEAWLLSYGEMCKKTVIHRLTKVIPVKFENAKQDEAFMTGEGAELPKLEKPKVKNPFEDAEDAEYSPDPKTTAKEETPEEIWAREEALKG